MTGPIVEVGPTLAAGGDGLGRLEDGRVVFVEGAAPDETVEVAITPDRRDHARGRVIRVVAPGPLRIRPVCPQVAAGCGGCGWAHLDGAGQLAALEGIVVDALRRLGRLDPPPPWPGALTPAVGHRTTVTLGVAGDGTLGYHRRHSAELVTVPDCRIAHARIEELIGAVRAPGWASVTLRVGVAGGERLAVVSPDPRSRRRGRRSPAGSAMVQPGPVSAPADVTVVEPGGDGWFHEDVGGRRWRVSARSFFQAGPPGASALVEAVDEAVGDAVDADGHLVDAYAGVGLLGGVVAERRRCRLTAVESARSSVADALVNLADLDARVVASEVGRATPGPADAVIADPARSGLGRPGVAALVATGAARLVLVSCDAASFGRDAGLLAEAGYRLAGHRVLGLFPDTAHPEVVSRFDRS